MRLRDRLPLSRKIYLGVLPLFLVFISVSVLLQNHFQEAAMMEEAQATARTLGEIVKHSLVSMMVNNLEVDERFLVRVNEVRQIDTLRIIVNRLRLRAEVLSEERAAHVARQQEILRPSDEVERRVLVEGEPEFLRTGDRFRAVIPFTADTVCQRCHAVPVGYTLGATDLRISFEQVEKAAQANWQRSLLIFVVLAALVVTVASLMFTRFVSRPVDRLVAATRAISRGNLQVAVPDLPPAAGSRDELLVLASRFDEMRVSLKEKIEELDRANRGLSERNREVEAALAQLRRAQEELVRTERLAAMGKLTAQLSHEINNPIHNIQSLLETSLRRLDPQGPSRELIRVALEEVGRLATLTRQMLDIYRGSMVEVELTPVDVSELLEEVARESRGPLEQQNIRVSLEVPGRLPPARGSRSKLKQVVLNLVANARDAQPTGGTVLLRGSADDQHVRVEVEDAGVGIPPENLDRIFDAFFTTKQMMSGVGLGLSVSYGIIQQHRGTISVKSEVGRGTTITLQLPRAEVLHA